MLIGAMNHPRRDVLGEIHWMAEMGLEFIDLTLEPPAAATWKVDLRQIRRALDETGLKVVGHTAYYLPIASPFEQLRRAAVDALCSSLEAFAELGVRWMNVHPDRYAPMHERAFVIQHDLLSLNELIEAGKRAGVGVMVENLPGDFNTVAQLGELLHPLPDLGLHLDIGHANLQVEENSTPALVAAYGSRIRHVHLHDNKGGTADLHLPLGTGTVDVRGNIRALKRSGYDATITLEVFSPDSHYLAYSRDVLRAIWNDV